MPRPNQVWPSHDYLSSRSDLKDLLVSYTVNSIEGTPKSLVFTEPFRNIFMAWFGIREADVRDALAAPDEKQSHQFDDLTLGFYTKRHQRSGIETYLLVCTQKTEQDEIVHQAFWAFPDLIREPLVLLQQLAARFGLALRVGNQLNKFIFRETITISGPVNAAQIFEVINPERHTCVPSLFFKITEDANSHHIHCALAFCIDIDVYTRWLTGAQSIEDMSFQIATQLQGHVTPQSLIGAKGTLEFQTNYNQLPTGTLIRIESRDYQLEVGLSATDFYILRNSDTLKRTIQPVYLPTGRAFLCNLGAHPTPTNSTRREL